MITLLTHGFVILSSKEPLFASGEKRKGRCIIYFDSEGSYACTNFIAPGMKKMICSICGNNCVQFIVDDKTAEYTCSACGKFPRESLLS